MEEANNYFINEQYDYAAYNYVRALELDRENEITYLRLIDCYMEMDRLEDAWIYLEEAERQFGSDVVGSRREKLNNMTPTEENMDESVEISVGIENSTLIEGVGTEDGSNNEFMTNLTYGVEAVDKIKQCTDEICEYLDQHTIPCEYEIDAYDDSILIRFENGITKADSASDYYSIIQEVQLAVSFNEKTGKGDIASCCFWSYVSDKALDWFCADEEMILLSESGNRMKLELKNYDWNTTEKGRYYSIFALYFYSYNDFSEIDTFFMENISQ